MKKLTVDLDDRSYPIFIGRSLLDQASLIDAHISGAQVMVVTNETVAPLYLPHLERSLSGREVHICEIPDGEKFKSFDVLEGIFDRLLRAPCDRGVTIVALGGGVVGDIAGFAAACYQRGVAYIQVPTTLLAQVDSSVGGKTAVNHPLGKNMIGAFHQPKAVIADIDTLNTLPDRELKAGLAEVIKYGMIRDPELFAWLESNIESVIEREPDALAHAVERSCVNKAAVVAADETEKGHRALLNFGHTFGHAIETATGYDTWLHGEAVGFGMLLATDLSSRMGNIDSDDVNRLRDLLKRTGLPLEAPGAIEPASLLRLMSVDKKVADGVIRLVLLRVIGHAYLCRDYPEHLLKDVLSDYFS